MTTEQAVATRPPAELDLSIIEKLVSQGDLSGLSSGERTQYYVAVCEHAGISPVGQPLEYLKLNGKLVLYATKRFTDQLRKVHRVSVTKVEREMFDELYTVTTYVQTPDGRVDSDVGAVPLGKLQGDARANAVMKAHTKSKRRATLSICGLGMLDETEVETIPGAERFTAEGEIVQQETPELADQRGRERTSLLTRVVELCNEVAGLRGQSEMATEVLREGAIEKKIEAKSTAELTIPQLRTLLAWVAETRDGLIDNEPEEDNNF